MIASPLPNQRYTHPDHPTSITFTSALLALPPEIQIRIFLLLSTDDLHNLARWVEELKKIDEDPYLRKIWFSQTVPARLDFALFSPLRPRPDPQKLVRRGTLRGIAIVSGVRSHGYWASESAVRLSHLHHSIHLTQLRRQLSHALSSPHRSSPSSLHARRILPSPSLKTSPNISAKAYTLEKAREGDRVKRALISAQICRTLGDVLAGKESLVARLWETEEVERVRWAICPGIREKKNFYEGLSRRI